MFFIVIFVFVTMLLIMKKLLLPLLLSAPLLGSCIGEEEGGIKTENYIRVGDPVPAFTIENSFGAGWNDLTSPEDFAGRKTLLVFFVTACPDCRRELPYVEYAFTRLQDEGLTVVPVGRSETHAAIDAYWAETGFTMPRYLDASRAVFSLFANQTVPRIYLVNEHGAVVWMCVEDLKMGAFTEDRGDRFNALVRQKLSL